MASLERMGSPALRLWRMLAYLLWTLTLMPVQAIGLLLHQSWVATFPCFYHRQCCRILGLRVCQIGRPSAARPALFAANHVSYLDITVFGSLLPASFIAKHEVGSWPLFGWLAKLQRSVFIDRQVRSTAIQRDRIAARLACRDALILFPEGTSGDGNRVLPFKSALFSVVDSAVTVQPVSVAYTKLDGMPIGRRLRPLFAWYGSMTMLSHLWRVLGLGTIEIVVEFHPPTTLAACGSRKQLARYCEAQVVAGVAAALGGRHGAFEEPTTTRPRHAVADAPAAAMG